MKWITVCMFCLLALPVLADEPLAMMDLLSGKTAPLVLPVKALGEGWFRISLGGAEGAQSGALQALAEQLGLGGGSYYTQGKLVQVGDVRYLIAYARPRQSVKIQAMMEGGGNLPPVAPLTGDTPLSLSLLDLRTAGSIRDIRAFNAREEIQAEADARRVVEEATLRGRKQESMNNLRQVAVGIHMYVQDNKDMFPKAKDAATLKEVLKPYMDEMGKILLQPGTNEPYLPNPTLAGKSLADIKDPTEIVLVYEATPWPDGTRCAAFIDGHVEINDDAHWQEAKRKSGLK